MKIYKKIFIITFFFILLIPTCFTNLKENQISEIDNSKLPELSTVKDMTTFQNYFSKRIGFRKVMINTYTYTNDILFGKMVHPTYTYGKDEYVFFKTGIEVHDNSFLDAFAKLVKNMQDYVTQRKKYFLFVINPTKFIVYNQYLPEGYNFTNYRVEYLKKKLDELEVNYIDNTDFIKRTSEYSQVFNIKYDAGHWNDTGAFYGINNIYDKLIEDGIEVSKLDMEDYAISTELKESLPVSEFKIYEEVPLYKIKNQCYKKDNKYSKFIDISESHKYYLKTTNSNNTNNLLFFRGSYMNDKEKFISNKFADSYLIHNYDNSINFDYYFNIANPDVVLFETVEYATNWGRYSSMKIKDKKYNKPYIDFKELKQSNSLININTDNILKEIEDNFKNNIPLTKIKLDQGDFEYAYLKLDNKVYDFGYYDKDIFLDLDTEILKKSSDIVVIVISKDLKSQQIIEVK